MGDHVSGEGRLHFLEDQEVEVDDFDASGLVLDLGGGGEGILGRLKGRQVVAIDPNRRELAEAPAGPLKIEMDARELKFLDGSFQTATAFFTLMYIEEADRARVFQEAFRVLGSGGTWRIWDAVLPVRPDTPKDIVAFRLTVRLPGAEVRTGYGARWPQREWTPDGYAELARTVGFETAAPRRNGRTFHLELRKP